MWALLIVIFVMTALGGLYLLSHVLANKDTPKGIALIHGVFATLGLITLLVASYYYHPLIYTFIIFLIAALGGTILFLYDLEGKKLPKFLAIGHGLIAITGLIILTLFIVYK